MYVLVGEYTLVVVLAIEVDGDDDAIYVLVDKDIDELGVAYVLVDE